MTTFTEMTPERRAECVGMWCDTNFGLAILIAIRRDEDDEYGLFIRPKTTLWHIESFEHITPRFDLPRAWEADGKPVEMEIEIFNGADGTEWQRHITKWEARNDHFC